MKVYFPGNHQTCKYYGKGSYPSPIAEKIILKKRVDTYSRKSVNEIVFTMKGSLRLIGGDVVTEVRDGQMFFLQENDPVSVKVLEKSELFVFRLYEGLELGNKCSLSFFPDSKQEYGDGMGIFTMNQRIRDFINTLVTFLEDGLNCSAFMEIKLTELFYLLRAYYPMQVLTDFFHPILIEKDSFTAFVLNNYRHTKTVKELARMSNYSLSGFEKEFKKIFGMPAYQWILRKKIAKVNHEVSNTHKPLKVIADECGFSSLSQLSDFCRKHLDMSPSKIRNIKNDVLKL